MSCPAVSIILPTYNRAELLGIALDSVASQTFRDYEIIVVDDGSTDGTADRIAARSEPIRYVWQENQGVAAARNHALALARADLVAFLDSDDVWLPRFLEATVGLLQRRPELALAYSDFVSVDAEGRPLRGHRKTQHEGDVTAQLFASVFIHTSCVVARRHVILEAGGFNGYLTPNEDYDMWLRLSQKYRFGLVHEPLCLRRTHRGSLSRNGVPANLVRKAKLLERFYFDQGGARKVPRDLAYRRLGRLHYVAARATFRARRFAEASELVRRSLQYRPSSLKAWSLRAAAALLRNGPLDCGRSTQEPARSGE